MLRAEDLIASSNMLSPEPSGIPATIDRLAAAEAVLVVLQSALDTGYSLALRINRHNMEALVGLAECLGAAAGKVAHAVGQVATAMQHWNTSLTHFEAALSQPQLIGCFSE
eukprot:gene27499-4809_t